MLEYGADGYLLSGTDPVMLGNGKVSFFTGDASNPGSALGVHDCIVTRSMDFSQNRILMDNTISSIQSGRWSVCKAQDNLREIPVIGVSSCGLDMRTAIHRLECDLEDTDIRVQLERYATYHLPYCTMQSIQVRSGADYELQVKHYVTLPKDFRLIDVVFSGNMISVSALDGSTTKHIMLAEGRISDSGKPIAVGVMYTIQDPSVTTMTGFQMLSEAGREAGAAAVFQVTANYPCTLHAMTCVLTGHDFFNPRDSVMRCLVSIASTSTMAKVRLDHVAQWTSLWKNDVVIEPRYTISQQEMADVQKVRRALRQSLYVLYSSVRIGVSNMLNVAPSLTVVDANLIDATGSVIAGDDMWIMPVLTMLNPSLARSIIEFRYQELMVAITTASQLGYSGAKYPSASDELSATTPYSVSWSSSANSRLYNTSLIAIHAWNYYRVTLDQQYLTKVGFAILSGIANFLASRASPNETNAYQYDFIGVTDVEGNLVINDFMDIFLAKFALNCAIEASFVVGVPVEQKWTDVKNGLKVEFVNDDANNGVPLPHMNFEESQDTFRFPSVLFPLFPLYFNDLCMTVFGSNQSFSVDMYARTLNFVIDRLTSMDFFSSIIVCGCVASLAQSTLDLQEGINVLSGDTFDTHMNNVLTHMNADFSKLTPDKCAAFVAFFLSGFCGTHIKGGIASGKFAYSTLEIATAPTSIMPKSWEKVTFNGNGNVMNTMNRSVL